jgi:FkbM family methyltransferase
MKNIIFKIYLIYYKYIPFNRGKQVLAKFLTLFFGSNFYRAKKGIWLDVYLKSPQDLYLLNFDGNDELTKLIESLPEESVFFDIGSNIGYYSFVAAKHFKQNGLIFSFEPSSREYIRLLRGIFKNKVSNIIPFNSCVSNFTGKLKLNVDFTHTGMNKIQTNKLDNSNINSVAVFRFDDFLKIFLIKKIDLIKVDVEGAEYLVLLGMEESLKKGMISKLFVEITPKFLNEYGHSKEMVYQFMTSCGFVSTINSTEWQYDEIFIFDNSISIN